MQRSGFLIALSLTALTSNARPAFRGPLPQDQKDIIHYMAQHHAELKRTVTDTKDGYTSTTTSNNPELVKKLKQHLAYMEQRLDSGGRVRSWDPAYVEMVEYYDQLEVDVSLLENGIKVTVTGKTPEAAKVALNHANIVSAFAANGQEEVRKEHAAALSR